MKLSRSLTTVLALAAALVPCAETSAQTRGDTSNSTYQTQPVPSVSSGDSYKTTPLPPVEDISPSSFRTLPSAKATGIAYVAENQMSEVDRHLVEGAEPSIRQDAAFHGIELGTGKWSYEQLVCGALPQHILLLFRGDNGTGDVSLFSAAIPRSGQGRVRVIAIQRRGYSLFSPAPENPRSISLFNQIRADEPASKNTDLLATALCFAALTGAHPEITGSPAQSTPSELALSFPPTLELEAGGDSTVRFVDVAAGHGPMEWALTFDANGRLLTVVNFPSPNFPVTPIPPISSEAATQSSH